MENILYFDKIKLIYLFVPKVACTSLRSYLIRQETGRDLSPREITDYQYSRISEADTIRLQENGVPVFAFVRNPWDRLVSCYQNKMLPDEHARRLAMQSGDRDEYQDGIFKGFLRYGTFRAGMGFDAFVKAVCAIPDGQANPHFMSQVRLLSGPKNKLLPDMIGYFGRLERDLGAIAGRAGLAGDLPHLRPGGGRDYRSYYTPRLRRMVAVRYAADIASFGFRFNGPEPSLLEGRRMTAARRRARAGKRRLRLAAWLGQWIRP